MRSISRPGQRRSRGLQSVGVACALVGLTGCASDSVQLRTGTDTAVVLLNGEAFATVHYAAKPRPFIYPVIGPGGVKMTRGFPMHEIDGEEKDHPHHQSLWFGHGNVNGFDFWAGSGRRERLVERGPRWTYTDGEQVLLRYSYDWLVDAETLVCTEERELRFSSWKDARVIDFTIVLKPGEEPLTLGDTKEGSFAMRVHPALRVEGVRATGVLINSEGQRNKDAWGKRARWIDDSGTIDGQEAGVSIFDHPSNPKHPTWWHARTYGLLAANPFGVHDFEGKPAGTGALTLPVGESLRLRYRLVLHGSGWNPHRIESAYQAWINE